jgi:hypothetical protein
VGDYKKLENMVGGMETASPENVTQEMSKLLENYHQENTHIISVCLYGILQTTRLRRSLKKLLSKARCSDAKAAIKELLDD